MTTDFCPRCAHSVDDGANFCGQCRLDVRANARQVETDGFRWSRQADEVAVKINSVDLKALLTRRLAVAEGTCGLLFRGEGLVEQLAPGPHTIESISERLKTLLRQPLFSVALVDTSDIPLVFQGAKATCSDGVEITFRADLALRVGHAADFYVNVMKGRTIVRTQDLHDLVKPLLEAAIAGVVHDCRADELRAPHPELRERLQDEIHASLDDRLTAAGLVLRRVDLILFRDEGRSELVRLQAQFNQELRLRRLQQDKNRIERQRDLEWKRFIAGVEREETLNKIDQARSEKDFVQAYADLAQETRIGDLVRKERWESLSREYQQRTEDQTTARRHLIAQLDWQRRSELLQIEHDFKQRELRSRLDLDDMQRQHELAREQYDHQLALRRNRDVLEAELAEKAAQREHERVQTEADLNAKLQGEMQTEIVHRSLRKGQFQDELAQQQQQSDEALRVQKLQFELHTSEKEAKLKRFQTLAEMDAEIEDREAQRGERVKAAAHQRQRELAGDDHSRQLETANADRDYQLERMKLMGQLPAEALLALSSKEQGELIARLQETRLLKDLSAEQILAQSAARDSRVADALAEVFAKRGQSESGHRAQIDALYDRMLRDQQAAAERQAAQHRETLEVVERVAARGLAASRDVGIAAATRPASPERPVALAPAPRPSEPKSDQPTELNCTGCGEPRKKDATFCKSCGADLK